MNSRKPWLVLFLKGNSGSNSSSSQVAALQQLVERQMGTVQQTMIDPSAAEVKNQLEGLFRDSALHKGLALSANGDTKPTLSSKDFVTLAKANATKGYFTVFLYNADQEVIDDWRDDLAEYFKWKDANHPQITLNVNKI